VIWGGEEPDFETETEMRTVRATIMGRYNEIAACFTSSPDDCEPVFWEGPVGEVNASDWEMGGITDRICVRDRVTRAS
jgi:hypothetical protein